MRILHVLDHSLPLHSGYTFRTAALLREQRALGWETFHLTSPKHEGDVHAVEEAEGFFFHRTPPKPSLWDKFPVAREIALMRQLEQRIEEVAREVKPDLIHAHSPVLNVLPALKVGRRLGIPVTYEIRAFWEDASVDHGTTREGSLRYRLTRALETHAVRQAAHVFTICEGLRADIVARGIPAAKVSVVPNAVDVQSFGLSAAPDPALQQRLGLAPGTPVVGFIGSFYAYEGLDLLVDALPAMLAQEPALRLLLVGGGPQDDNLKAQAQRLGVADRIVFTGRVPHKDVNRYYDLIDVLVYPRHSMRLTELVTPLKPLEAMAQGRLFVASDVGGHKELVEHGRTGVLFKADDTADLAQATLALLRERERWPALKANGRQFVEEVRNWRQSVANYQQPFTRLIESTSR
ncbi:TIGR04063 family PEP-CTERM/XrtA system glycosyltransferase [Pseudorhodoferax sp. Leaf267]|uniref:TIGR04063 family PEP-CTERM/XrtA system glycosyltransferase n=1 Tax=Pseudorhodoferax sp. Leaf267 TaxID=1736316 RepID=UPI0006F8B72E|nr:TIGR04063 family PEP-CTERM/XrtA system glycosyltransferase [Pseudorhodoferax sp. Leaf267]KQP23152.1 glycosyl transferase family 1 [Pseudorhodoferax sp. Leaf267]